MDKKKLLLIAAAGVLATKPVLTMASNIVTRVDLALDTARQEVRNEQPLMVDATVDASSDALPAQMY
jgi:hypothetical protein